MDSTWLHQISRRCWIGKPGGVKGSQCFIQNPVDANENRNGRDSTQDQLYCYLSQWMAILILRSSTNEIYQPPGWYNSFNHYWKVYLIAYLNLPFCNLNLSLSSYLCRGIEHEPFLMYLLKIWDNYQLCEDMKTKFAFIFRLTGLSLLGSIMWLPLSALFIF